MQGEGQSQLSVWKYWSHNGKCCLRGKECSRERGGIYPTPLPLGSWKERALKVLLFGAVDDISEGSKGKYAEAQEAQGQSGSCNLKTRTNIIWTNQDTERVLGSWAGGQRAAYSIPKGYSTSLWGLSLTVNRDWPGTMPRCFTALISSGSYYPYEKWQRWGGSGSWESRWSHLGSNWEVSPSFYNSSM